jgi:hypothetical protein
VSYAFATNAIRKRKKKGIGLTVLTVPREMNWRDVTLSVYITPIWKDESCTTELVITRVGTKLVIARVGQLVGRQPAAIPKHDMILLLE